MGVSTDWCVTVKHWKLSSIRIIFIDSQTSELQYNYQSYIQVYTIEDTWGFSSIVLQPRDLRVGQQKESCIGLTQENSIENSVQDCPPYIQIPNGLCELFLAYPKQQCVCLKVNMCFTCCMTSSVQNLLRPSIYHVICDHVI